MKRRWIIWLVLLTATFLVCLYSSLLPHHAVARIRIVAGRDVSDIVGAGPSQAKTGYDLYFNRINVALPYFNVTGSVNTPNPGR
jgi:uncharacterized protein involved in exopolysaccharide biosynthesis